MNANQVTNQLYKKYPGKKIIKLPPDHPTEILCEIDPTSKHPRFSITIAIIDKSLPHFHRKTTEIYQVIKGSLTLEIEDKKYYLKEGQQKTIKPNQIHSAKGKQTWIKVTSHPGWSGKDQVFIETSS